MRQLVLLVTVCLLMVACTGDSESGDIVPADDRQAAPDRDQDVSFVGVNVRGVGPAAMPSTLLLDDQHRVAARFFGAVTYGQVQQRLEPLLAERDGEIEDAADVADTEAAQR